MRVEKIPLHPRERAATEWSAQDVQEAIDNCAMMLDEMNAEYTAIESIREGQCGAPAPIELSRVGKVHPVTIEPPARVTCGMAASLTAWTDKVLQPAAQAVLGETIAKIRNVASYVCRNRYNAPGKRISEHARANALDMAAFTTRSGRVVTVLDGWSKFLPASDGTSYLTASGPADGSTATDKEQAGNADGEKQSAQEPAPVPANATAESPPVLTPSPESEFLRQIHVGGCELFGTVLGPEANEAHRDHFHFDLAERRHSNFCE